MFSSASKMYHLGLALLFCAGFALFEGISLYTTAEAPFWSIFVFVGVDAPLVLPLALALAAMTSGVARWFDLTSTSTETTMAMRTWRWLSTPSRRHTRLALALPIGASVYSVLVALGAHLLVPMIQTPTLLSASIALAVLAALPLTIGLMSWPWLGLGKALVAMESKPALAKFLRPITLIAPAILFGLIGLWINREFIAATPWHLATGALGGLLAMIALDPIVERRPVIASAASAFALTALAAFAFFLPGSLEHWDTLLDDTTSSASLILAPAKRALDADGDGAINRYGGLDCAPDDKKINPGALDIPNNGVDEDCSGEDLTHTITLERREQKKHPLPKQWRERTKSKKPHVIVITVDALSMDHTSIGGYKRDLTPALAALAKHSLVYEDAFATGPSTRLSFPSMMASTYNALMPLTSKRRHPYGWSSEAVTLAEVAKRGRYHTTFLSGHRYFSKTKWPGLTQGFDRVEYAPKKPEHTSEWLTKRALELLEQAEANPSAKPLFLWIHYYDPHGPYKTPEGITPFGDTELDRYDAEVAYMDTSWKPLLERVVKDEMILALTADHGEVFGRPGTRRKHGFSLDTRVLHVPFVMHVPGAKPRRVEGLVSQLDLATTIANLLDLEPPERWLGESLTPTIFEEKAPEKNAVVGLYYLPEKTKKKDDPFIKISLRTDDFLWVEQVGKKRGELFRWREDANHKTPITREVASKDTASAMRFATLETLDDLRSRERGLTKKKQDKTPKKKAPPGVKRARATQPAEE